MTVLEETENLPENSTRTDSAFSMLAELIIEGTLAPGAIVNEAELAEQFGMSRGPVREAVRRLQGRRLITREPYMKARVISLSSASLLEIFEIREALEGMACKLATKRMSDEDVSNLILRLEASRAMQTKDLDFHTEIAKASGNTRIVAALCDELYYLLRLYRRKSGQMPGRGENAYREHWQIARAIQSRDADLAESLMRSHINSATERVTQQVRDGELDWAANK